MPVDAPIWNCPSCSTPSQTPFCGQCGERPIQPFDLSVKGVFAQVMKTVGGIDGRVVRSLRALLGAPGSLTEAHRRGMRKPYLGPFQLFLVCNVFFFAVQSLTKAKIFASTLDSHLHLQDWSELAGQLVARRLQAGGLTLDRYAPLFDQAVTLNAKSLVILMVVPIALLLPLLFRSSRQKFAVHVAFALHLYAFLLIVYCLALVVVGMQVWSGGSGLASHTLDAVLTLLILGACAVYLSIAVGRVYAVPTPVRFFGVAVLVLAVGAAHMGYRFALLLITLATT